MVGDVSVIGDDHANVIIGLLNNSPRFPVYFDFLATRDRCECLNEFPSWVPQYYPPSLDPFLPTPDLLRHLTMDWTKFEWTIKDLHAAASEILSGYAMFDAEHGSAASARIMDTQDA